MENKKITCLSEIENQLYSKEIKMTGENHADYGFNAYVSQEVLGGISKAFLDLHNSIVENQMIH